MKGPIAALVLIFELTNHIGSLVVPLILAIGVATLIARHFDGRSIYTARIHSGLAVAAEMKQDQVISAAMHYRQVLKRLLGLSDKTPLYVVDEAGAFTGRITAEQARQADSFASPLESACANEFGQACQDTFNRVFPTSDAGPPGRRGPGPNASDRTRFRQAGRGL